jgi:hypothetical protein
VIARQYTQGINEIIGGDDPVLDTTEAENNIELKKEAEEMKLFRMAKFHGFLEMLQGSPNLHATQKESRAQNKPMTAVGYILDTE